VDGYPFGVASKSDAEAIGTIEPNEDDDSPIKLALHLRTARWHPSLNGKEAFMSSRNTAVLKQILQSLEISEPHALSRLETLFQDSLLG